MTILDLRLQEIHDQLQKKELTVSQLIHASLERIKEVDGRLNAFLTVDAERALQRAEELDRHAAEKQKGLLFGLPVGIKDNISTKNVKTTCASRMLANYVPIFDATVIKKLFEAQAVMIGKMNMDEFAMGSSNENSAFGIVHNPWDAERVPGGSSGGPAAAVAAREVYFALASDTGGSIRIPAAYCGVVGLKPSYGLVSRFGLVAYASSLDQIGPITKNVEDAAYLLQVLAGYDPQDSTSVQTDIPDYVSALDGNIDGMTIGVPKEYMGDGISPEVKQRVNEALQVLEKLGANIKEVSLPHTESSIAAYYIISSSEASSNLARFDGIRYGTRAEEADNLMDLYKKTRSQGFGPEVKRRIMLGTHSLSSGYYDAYYLKAQKARTLVKQDFDNIFAECDVVIGPTTTSTAFKIGEKTEDVTDMYQEDILTCPVNLAGLPALSVPCGFDSQGLPVGMQIIGKAFDESTLLKVAHAFEQNTEHHQARPNL